ncbi:MAG: 2-nitropropane dioxygenase [Actinomycetia bacterium]|nr:2-nitropropane dioxygenase [Actinomycetes bacterium]
MRTRLAEDLGLEFPIFAFSHCRDAVAAVSRAGGMGVLGALYYTPDELEIELKWIEEHVDGRPYGVDLVMPAKIDLPEGVEASNLEATLEGMITPAHREFVEKVLAEYDVPPLPDEERGHHLLGWTPTTGRPQLEITLQHSPALLVNALGPPPPDVVDIAHEHGMKVAALASTVGHAQKHVANGVDIVVAQGTEAGGHTGEISSMVLWPEVIEAISPTPVLAAGGIAKGSQIAAALAMGAQGAWTGSIWLTVAESDSTPLIIEKLLQATSRDTVRSRALTGKPARQLRTEWTDAWDRSDSPGTLPMPLQFMLVSDAMRRIARAQRRELTGFPVGQVVGMMNQIRPARDVVLQLVDEYIEAVERLEKLQA